MGKTSDLPCNVAEKLRPNFPYASGTAFWVHPSAGSVFSAFFQLPIDKDSCQWYAVYDNNRCQIDMDPCQKGGAAMPLENRLKELRAARGLNQQELGSLVGASRQTISLIERGDYNPSVTLALRIARVFGKPVDDVFFLTEEDEA